MTLLSEGWRRMAVRGELVQVDERLAELGELSRQALKEMRLIHAASGQGATVRVQVALPNH